MWKFGPWIKTSEVEFNILLTFNLEILAGERSCERSFVFPFGWSHIPIV